MNFDYSDEQKMLQDMLGRFLRETATPEVIAQAAEAEAGHSAGLWSGLTELGVAGALFGEAAGGFGGTGTDLALVFEEFGRAGVFEPLLESAVLAGGLIDRLGSPAQKALIDGIIGGEILALAHAEPGARYETLHVETTARPEGDGWRLTGHKTLVMGGPAAGQVIVSARTAGEARDRDGISLFLLPVDAPGLVWRSYPLLAGGRASELVLDNPAVAHDRMLGGAGRAAEALEQVTAAATVALCAEAVGLMERMKDLTVDHLRTRVQFGKPLGKFQALQHRMAKMLIEIEQARSAVINASGHLEAAPALRDLQVSAAKNLIGRSARLVVEETIQMHGGIGMTMEYALGRLARRLTMIDHRFGDADWHLERFMRLAVQA